MYKYTFLVNIYAILFIPKQNERNAEGSLQAAYRRLIRASRLSDSGPRALPWFY